MSLAYLAGYPRWVAWILQPSEDGAKPRKVPVHPVSGIPCDYTDPACHTTYAEVMMAGRQPAFVFCEGDGLWFLDLDNCRLPDNSWSELAQSIVRSFGGHALCEISQSGNGLHLFGWASSIPQHRCRNVLLGLELYHTKRFVAFTGREAYGAIDADTAEPLAHLVSQYFSPSRGHAGSDIVDWTTAPMPGFGLGLSDDELLKIMLRSGTRSAGAMFSSAHVAFADLWEGHSDALACKWPSSTPGQLYDASEADSALACHLAYWTAKDCAAIERFMLRSALARPKYDRPDYLPRTILNACQLVRETATPRIPAVSPSAEIVTPAMVRARGISCMTPAEQITFFNGCVYVSDLNRIWVACDGSLQDKARFEVTFGGCDFAFKAEKTEKSAWEAYLKNHYYTPRIAKATCFRPELESGTITWDGLLNIYRPNNIPMKEGDASKWVTHLRKLFPKPRDFDIITTYLAATVRSPGAKHQWAPVIQGCEGNAKTLIHVALAYAIGAPYVHIARAASLARTGIQFNKWINNTLYVCFEEINVGDRRDFLEEIKDLITNRTVAVEGKGLDQTVGDNRANFLFLTNHKDAIPTTRENRRYAVFFTPQQSLDDLTACGMDRAYFADLWDWVEGRNRYHHLGPQGGLRIIAHWLHHDAEVVEEFDPRGACQRAPSTSSSEEAYEVSLGAVEQEIIELVESGAPGFCGGWISSYHLGLALERLRLGRMTRIRRHQIMTGLGYVVHPSLPGGRCTNFLEGLNTRPRLYLKQGHLALNFADPRAIQKAYEEAQRQPATGLASQFC